MKKLLSIATSFTILFNSIATISCSNYNYYENKDDQIISNYIDFDCDEEVELNNKVEGNFEEDYPKNINFDFYKVQNSQ